MATIDAANVADDAEVPLEQRAEFAALGSGARRVRLIRAARIVTAALARAVPVMVALREAAGSDYTARVPLECYEAERRRTVAAGLELITSGPAPDVLVDSIWALASAEVFGKLVIEAGWPVEHYEQWLVSIAGAVLRSWPA